MARLLAGPALLGGRHPDFHDMSKRPNGAKEHHVSQAHLLVNGTGHYRVAAPAGERLFFARVGKFLGRELTSVICSVQDLATRERR